MIIILIIYNITKTEYMYPLKHSLGTALSHSLSSVYSYFTYMIGLTKRSHVAPKMQHIKFYASIVRFDWFRTKCIDSVCGVTWIPLCEKDGSVITWVEGRGNFFEEKFKFLGFHAVVLLKTFPLMYQLLMSN